MAAQELRGLVGEASPTTRAHSAYSGIVVVIPTRNRAELAQNAVRSVLDVDCPGEVRVVVSDNSTDSNAARRLAEFCRSRRYDRLHYIRPAAPLPMTDHWEWALQYVLDTWSESHVLYLTDRMIFRPGELRRISEIVRQHPGEVVCYNFDHLIDHTQPIRIHQRPWTGRVYRIESSDVTAATAQAFLDSPGQPKMLNSVVPRATIGTLQARFSRVFDSVAPDFNFCFRCLACVDSVLYYDSSAIIHYAADRSNGASLGRGVRTSDYADFVQNLGEQALSSSAPLPAVRTVGNVIFHEYCRVRQETRSPRFPYVNRGRYLEYLANELEAIEDEGLRAEMRSLVVAAGWQPPTPLPRRAAVGRRLRQALRPKLLAPRVRSLIFSAATAAWTKPIWRLLASHAGVSVPRGARFEFQDRDEALRFALGFRPRPLRTPAHLQRSGFRIQEVLN